MNAVDLKKRFGDEFKIEHDPAAAHEPSGRRDPWYYTIPCRKGHIYPHSATHLALWWDSASPLDTRCPPLTLYQEGMDERVYLFTADDFDAVARVVGARRKRRLSPEHRAALVRAGRQSRYKRE